MKGIEMASAILEAMGIKPEVVNPRPTRILVRYYYEFDGTPLSSQVQLPYEFYSDVNAKTTAGALFSLTPAEIVKVLADCNLYVGSRVTAFDVLIQD